jgi:CubicO group peptidase (beta-lactamase class C family)
MSTAVVEPEGFCSSGFQRVFDAFVGNFRDHGELGADLMLIVGGEVVADLRAGWMDAARTRPWGSNTIVNVWSTTKGITAVCFAMIVERGLCAYEDKVSRYWPEFAAHGKGNVTIGMLLAHQGGLSGFDTPATMEDLLSGEAAARRLAGQAPLFEPGTTAGYHGATMGILSTALFSRIEGRSIKQFVSDEIADAFDLDISIGVKARDFGRVAEMIPIPPVDASMLDKSNIAQYSVFRNPPIDGAMSNDPAWRAADLPSANGYSNARALATFYDLLLRQRADGRRLVGGEALAEATRCRFEGVDIVKGEFQRWSAGFWLNPGRLYGPNLEAFGHSGLGGSFAFADPVAGVAAAYTMNKMSDQFEHNPRRRGLIDAVYASL